MKVGIHDLAKDKGCHLYVKFTNLLTYKVPDCINDLILYIVE